MRYLSVCSGIEAATSAWHPLGWEPFAFSEIEPFPCAVLAHHYPNVPNLGDMTKFKEWPDAAIDVLVGGTPCQSFSVAGLRKGLADPRGNLMLTYGAIAAKYRPQWLVWENVPGVLSSNGGRDFGTFLGMLGELGYGFAYRVLDAQFFGVAQRRRRVFVVGHLGDWRRAAAVLFERHSLQGNPAPSREAGQVAAAGTLRSTGGGSDVDHGRAGHLVAGTLNANGKAAGSATQQDAECGMLVTTHTLRGEGFDASEDGTGRGTPLVPVAFDCKASGQSGFGVGDVASTMRAMGHAGSHQNGGGRLAVAFAQNSRDEVRLINGDGAIAGALAAEAGMKQQTYLAQAVSLRGREGGATAELGDEVGNCLRASGGGGDKAHVLAAMQVRRLTPVECERLQGFSPVLEILRIEGCTDHQKKTVHVEIGSHRLQCNAWNAAEKEYLQFASTAKAGSHMPQASHVRRVALYARRHYAESPLALLSAGGELKSNASSAADQSWSRSRIDIENFAALLAPHWESLVKEAAHGKAASQQSIRLSLEVKSGNQSATKFGGVIAEYASDAIADASAEKSITSHPVRVMPTCDSPTATSLCSVMNAINSCIQNGILNGSFCVDLVLERDYTNIPYRNKPACDGPRYKALGNSMAVPVMAWIGERIQMVEAITLEAGKVA
ncbi:MAG: DNA cytosine methyltransferase [Sphingobium sp.]